MNLHNPKEFDELLRQRIVCGWSNDRSYIEAWRDAADQGAVSAFWITTPSSSSSPSSSTTAAFFEADDGTGGNTNAPVGHIALQSATQPPDLEMANPDKSLLTITMLFIDPAHRGGGLAKAAILAMEAYARTAPYGSPDCKAVTLTTLSRRYAEDEGPDARGIWARMGWKAPPMGQSVEKLYARMGYVKWKEQPMYPVTLLDGTHIKLVATFMRKELS